MPETGEAASEKPSLSQRLKSNLKSSIAQIKKQSKEKRERNKELHAKAKEVGRQAYEKAYVETTIRRQSERGKKDAQGGSGISGFVSRFANASNGIESGLADMNSIMYGSTPKGKKKKKKANFNDIINGSYY